jgi:hypothetical protein
MRIIKVGIIGKGYFGKKIFNTLKSFCTIEFFTGSEMNITYDIDWVVIASSSHTHYKLAKHFIEKGINVFVEKPMALSYNNSKELVDLANKYNVKLYVDDVFRYNPIVNNLLEKEKGTIRFEWNKYGSFRDNIFNNLTYHDLYLAILLGYNLDQDIDVKINRVNEKEIHIDKAEFYYNRLNSSKSKVVRIGNTTFDFRTNLNLLDTMFRNVFEGTVSFEENNKIALKVNSILDRLQNYKPKVAVIGGGIFGVTSALKLQKDFDVTLFEKNDDILKNASGINQYRLHRGYHYPRSKETAISAKDGTETFLQEYPCALPIQDQYYGIAAIGSKVNSSEYINFLKDVGLEFKEVESKLVNKGSIDKLFQVNEGLFDPKQLYNLCKNKLDKSSIDLKLNTQFSKDLETYFDYVINATYSNLNENADIKKQYQFELCEKPVVKLDSKFKNKGIVIMDGPFTCIDPYSDTDYHVVGNVVHAIHHTNIGTQPIIPDKYKDLLNKGIVKNPSISNWVKFKEVLEYFFNHIDDVEHIGSMFTIRAVLTNRDFDDARPSIIEKESKSKFLIFSGKISTAVDTANKLFKYILKS